MELLSKKYLLFKLMIRESYDIQYGELDDSSILLTELEKQEMKVDLIQKIKQKYNQ